MQIYGSETAAPRTTMIDLNLPPEWKFNLGAGFRPTESTDRLIVNLIPGRRFSL